jgi:predicted methyltransferase
VIRAALLALSLAFAASASAQEVTPRTDTAALRKEAIADPAIKAVLADTSRPFESRLRDDGRMVELILKAANAKPGDRVLDVASGGGYLALLFSKLVGEKGHVDIHNTWGWIAQFPSMDPDLQKSFIKRPNIGWATEAWDNLDALAESYDIIVMGQVYHDIVLEGGDFDALNKRLFAMLKPGGRVVIEDHDAIETMPLGQQAFLHRISHGDTIGHFIRAGFRHTDLILIESTHDDRRFNVFRPGVRGRTDRFIAVFEKPKV